MRRREPFQPEDLAELDEHLLDRALAVVPMRNVYGGQRWPMVIGLRHDVDNVIEPAVDFARWEAERGFRSTYYILHTAPYWSDKRLLQESLEQIAGYGHEIGIHNNALAAAVATGMDPRQILAGAIGELRGYGYEVSSTVAHGDSLCYDQQGKIRFVNDELFEECPRPQIGAADRKVGRVQLRPAPLADFGLDFDANWLPRDRYLSDSGGRWSSPFDEIAGGFPYTGQLHMLIHPDWWPQAFAPEELTV